MKMPVIWLSVFLFSSITVAVSSAENDAYRCGIAVGFPPYQFVDPQGRTAGMDYEITKAVFEKAGLKVVFVQGQWDDVMFSLAHRTGDVDFLCGAEVSDERNRMFDFSDVCYARVIRIFVLDKSDIRSISDLNGKIISGDRHSYYERYLTERKMSIRLMQTRSKEESFLKLRGESVAAVIAPLEVGLYISRNLDVHVRMLGDRNIGTPVAFAVGKGDSALLDKINEALRQLVKEGKIEKIKAKYMVHPARK
jgi:ABC-type amino acid transport substrate-binding protein